MIQLELSNGQEGYYMLKTMADLFPYPDNWLGSPSKLLIPEAFKTIEIKSWNWTHKYGGTIISDEKLKEMIANKDPMYMESPEVKPYYHNRLIWNEEKLRDRLSDYFSPEANALNWYTFYKYQFKYHENPDMRSLTLWERFFSLWIDWKYDDLVVTEGERFKAIKEAFNGALVSRVLDIFDRDLGSFMAYFRKREDFEALCLGDKFQLVEEIHNSFILWKQEKDNINA